MTGIEQLKKKIESDSELAKSLENAANKDELLQKIKDAGIDAALEEIAGLVPAEGELDDSELEAVAGGIIPSNFKIKPNYSLKAASNKTIEYGPDGEMYIEEHVAE